MKYKKLFILIFAILLITACSKDTNKADLDEEMFKEGKQVVKLYAQVYNGEDKGDEASESAQSFLKKYREDAESNLPVNELFFVQSIELLNITYLNYFLQTKTEELGGDSDSEGTKEKMRNLLLQIKDEYGISLE